MHIFLTGIPGVGKSTIIKKAVKQLNLRHKGFLTVAGGIKENGVSNLYMLPSEYLDCDEDEIIKACDVEYCIANRFGENRYQPYNNKFDSIGSKLLKKDSLRDVDILIMDELGFMEREAYQFQEAVVNCVKEIEPSILGVIKPKDTLFLNGIRKNNHVKVIEVTTDNREEKLQEVVSLLSLQKNSSLK